jgi:hypothetical protein
MREHLRGGVRVCLGFRNMALSLLVLSCLFALVVTQTNMTQTSEMTNSTLSPDAKLCAANSGTSCAQCTYDSRVKLSNLTGFVYESLLNLNGHAS